MFNQITELFQTSLKPINKLVELNISTASTVAQQQELLIASLMADSLTFSRKMSVPTDIANFVAEQSKFSSDIQIQLTKAMKQTSGTLTKAQKNAEVILSDSFSVLSTKTTQAVVESQPVAPKAAVKVAPNAAVKAAPKK
jgi:phasin family protein